MLLGISTAVLYIISVYKEYNQCTRTNQEPVERTKEEHPQEVRAAPLEGSLLQRLAILDKEEHMEYKVKACSRH